MLQLPTLYKKIENEPQIKEYLCYIFDFDMVDTPHLLSSTGYFNLSQDLIVLAQDATGSYYTIADGSNPDQAPVLFLDSEWHYGRIADNFTEFLVLLLNLPAWHSLTSNSFLKNLQQAREQIAKFNDEFIEDAPELPAARQYIYDALDLPHLEDPLLNFYRNLIKSTEVKVKAIQDDGTQEEYDNFVHDITDSLREEIENLN